MTSLPFGNLVYDHDRVVVVDKDAGTSSEEVAAALGKKLVHRIDRPTSGLLILADDARTVQRLQRQLAGGGVERTYRAVTHGAPRVGRYETTLVRDRGDGRRGSGPGGKVAVLDIVDVEPGVGAVGGGAGGVVLSLVTVRLQTGRTHQIRIQLAEAGHAVVGEFVYDNDADVDAPRLLLHAARLRFTHPGKDRAIVEVEAPLPRDFWPVKLFHG